MSKLFACDYCGRIIQRDEIYTMTIAKTYYKPLFETGETSITRSSLDQRCDLCRSCVMKIKKLKVNDFRNSDYVATNDSYVSRNDIFP